MIMMEVPWQEEVPWCDRPPPSDDELRAARERCGLHTTELLCVGAIVSVKKQHKLFGKPGAACASTPARALRLLGIELVAMEPGSGGGELHGRVPHVVLPHLRWAW